MANNRSRRSSSGAGGASNRPKRNSGSTPTPPLPAEDSIPAVEEDEPKASSEVKVAAPSKTSSAAFSKSSASKSDTPEPKKEEFLQNMTPPQRTTFSVVMVVLIVVLSVLVYNTGMNLYYKQQKAVGVVNGHVLTGQDAGETTSTPVTAEAVLDAARKEVISQEMDKLGVAQVSDADLEKEKATYIGDQDWASVAKSQNSTEDKIKQEVKFIIRLGKYKDKALNVDSASLKEPTYPSKETSEAVDQYNKDMTAYQAKAADIDAKWKTKLNEIFSKAKITIFTLAVQ